MVHSISGGNPIHSALSVSKAYGNAVSVENTKQSVSYDDAVQVALSEGAKTVKETLTGFPPFNLDPAFNLQKAETRLKELMAELGMPATEEINITVNPDGSFEVEGEHPLTTVIEEKLNDGSERELSNSIKRAHTGTVLQRIAAAVEMASNAAEQDPMNADFYYNWIRDTASPAASAMGYEVSFANGTLSGSLVNSEGQKVAAGDGLTLPSA